MRVIFVLYLHDFLPGMQRLAVKRLTDVGIGVLTPVAEQLAQPLPHAMALATLDEIASGAHKELPAGTQAHEHTIFSYILYNETGVIGCACTA